MSKKEKLKLCIMLFLDGKEKDYKFFSSENLVMEKNRIWNKYSYRTLSQV